MSIELTIAIPCYNEEGNICRLSSELIPVLKKHVSTYEILIIDDGSTDHGKKEINTLIEQDSSVRCISHAKNLGLGIAVKTAISHARGELIIFLDADLTFHPNDIPILLHCYNKTRATCVIGSFFLSRETLRSIAPHRLFITSCANKLYGLAFGANFTAYTPLFRLYKTSVLRSLPLVSRNFDISAEILFRLIQSDYRICEVPVRLGMRKIGVSKIQFLKETLNHLSLAWHIIHWRLKGSQKL